MSTDELRPRRIIIVELEAIPSALLDNDGATDRTSARIQQKHDQVAGGVHAQAVEEGEPTPSGIPQDAERDHDAEARIVEKGAPRLQAVLAERTLAAIGHTASSAASAIAAAGEVNQGMRAVSIAFHIRAEHELDRAIGTVVGFWTRSCPTVEEVVRDTIKDCVKSAILATAVVVGAKIVG